MAISVKVSALTEDVAAAPANAVDADGTIALEQPRKVLLSLSPDDVQELRRDGDDLLVRTTDGQVIRIENFYGGAETTTSQLYLTGDDQELIWADLSSAGGDGVIAADYFPQGEFGVFEPVSVAGGESEGASITPLGWAAIGGGALAAGAIAAGGGGGGGSDDDDGGTAPPDDGENGEGDTTAPDAPTLDPSNGETISGEAEPGSTVIITDGDGNTIGEATTDDDGNWTLTPDEPLPDGTDIEVVAQDPAGNTSEPTTGTIDAAAPDAPTLDPSNGETISGEAEPGSTVIITDGDGNPIGETTTDDDGNWTLTPDEPLPDGTDIEVVAQDPTGNTSEPTTGTIDAVAPNAPTLDPSNGETISGEAEPGSTVIITDGDGNPIGETTTDDDGNWTLTPDEPLPDGTDIEVVAQDPAGNTSEPTTGTIDAAAPDAPTLDPSNGETISGEAEPGSTVIITDGDGNPIGETTTDEDGNWTLTPDEPLPDGTDIEVVAQDPTGNTSEPTTGTIDAAAPDAPTITTVMDDVDPQTGELATGDSTNDTTPRLTGQAEAGSTVTIFANGEQTGTTTADDQGNWAFTPDDLDDGDYTFSATATDSVGNVSDGSDGYALTIDTSAPNSPTVDPSDGSVLIGTAEAGSVVTLTDDEGNAVGQTTTDENGNWSFQPDDPLADGTEIEATATDAAGNVSAPATVITDANPSDTTPPATPSITLASDDTMPQTGDLDSGDSTNDATPTLSGQAESRSIVTVYSGETQLGTTIANADGEWAFTPESLDDGDYTFNVTATDSAGNMSDSSDSFTLTVDTQPPVAPIVDPTNGEILTGSAEAGSTVTLTDDDGDTIATVTSDVNGNWSYAPDAPLEDGSTFTAVATDAAGNASDPGSATVDADLVDTQPPSEPVIITSIDTTEPVTGNVDDGDTTNDPSPTLIGTAEATNMVQVWADDGSGSGSGSGMQMLGTTQADNFGNWSFRIFSRLAEGNTSFMAKSIDPTGQESDSSQPFAVVIDITPPATPTIDSATDDVDPGGMLDDGDNTNDATPTLIGTAEANAVVAILAGGTQIGTVAADDNGDWTFTPDALPDGNVDFTATATDAAGNVSPASPSFTVSVDTAAPATPTIEPTDGNTITGTAEPGSTITLTDGEGNVIAEDVATDPDDGSWSVTPETPLDDGGTVNAVATDQAGNASDPATEIVDATAPNANDNSIQINDGGDGFLNVEEAGNVTLAGQVEDGASIASLTITSANGGDPVVIDGDEITLGDDGSFTYNADLSGLADGELTATLALSDAAGNDGTVTDTTTLDQTAPIVTLDALDEPINDITPAITGTVDDAGATVSVSVNGGEPITATVDEDGNWTVPADSVTLNEGDNTIEVTATDAAGNPATPATDTVSVDITAPTVAVDDLITNDTTPALSGTVDDAEATVTVTVDGDDYTATNNGDGTWALADDIVAELDPGAASISVTATDLAGNEATATGTVTVDITAPGDGDDGLNSVAFADDVYNAAEADTATLAGQVEDGASIASLTIISANGGDPVVIDGDEITLGDDGSFTYNADLSGLADGELTATLTLSDAAGNDGTVTDTATLDQTAPIVAIDALDEPINDTTPAITGTVDDPDATVSVSVNGGEPITATVDEDGNWNVSADSVTLNEGDNTIEVTATDAAGNPATPATDTVSVDITAPGDGDDGLNSVAFADDVYNAAEADTAALAGQIEGGASIASLTITSANGGDPVVIDGDEITLGDNGSFTYNADLSGLADGELTATLALSDAAGNDGTVTDTATLDQTAPTVAIDALDEPINDTTPAITGTVDDPGATVSVSVNGGEPITATVDNNGNWNVPADSVTLNEGDNTIEVTATDAAGNPSTPATDTVSVDITAPGEGEGDNSVTIVSGDDELLSLDEAGNVTLTGQVEDGASIASLVITSVNGGDPLEIDPATIDIAADGSFSLDGIDVTGLNDGELTATLTVEDAAGNAAEFTDTATLDTVAPNVPT
ncbi:Ig-like domain-containing protein, partial [Salinicola halophyticus]|uniref:Ig-like domain-containing protein n=1 Tax=Salinicola halophyticus TaxID=1808881 RepID=UPI003F4651E1